VEEFIQDVLLTALALALLSIPTIYVVFGPKIQAIKNNIDGWLLKIKKIFEEWLSDLREAKAYTNKHSPEAIARSRRERNRREALETIEYYATWISEHRAYLVNAAPRRVLQTSNFSHRKI